MLHLLRHKSHPRASPQTPSTTAYPCRGSSPVHSGCLHSCAASRPFPRRPPHPGRLKGTGVPRFSSRTFQYSVRSTLFWIHPHLIHTRALVPAPPIPWRHFSSTYRQTSSSGRKKIQRRRSFLVPACRLSALRVTRLPGGILCQLLVTRSTRLQLLSFLSLALIFSLLSFTHTHSAFLLNLISIPRDPEKGHARSPF